MENVIYNTFVRKEVISNRKIISIIGVASFVLFMAFGAHVYIPLVFTPVPITMQTFFVLLCGAILGKHLGSFSAILYIILGAAGIPIFSTGTWGFSHVFGPTGGYLFGFAISCYVIGRVLEKRDSLLSIIIALLLGEFIIFCLGAIWLMILFHISLRQALFIGVVPFIAGDSIKLVACVFLCKKCLKRAKGLFY